ncbi:sigma factor [Amycolatopsis anabasis]|uniref:sigma factor n=1 Tax=Amycolatopsis anabasis TaxID=1840409 RepID=UPI00131B8348|nr:sigma-70 family RNA polymerase sigma factor [Amycolatopsis anabasis]
MTEQGTVLPRVVPGSDEQVLLKRLRAGEDAAFGELFELHAAAVRRLALGLANDRSEAEDITAETFFRVLQALRRGAGPKDHVRAYLLTVARRVSWEWHGAKRDVPVTDDELTHRAGAGADTHARSAEHSLIARAFTSLPERWRTVLWQTEVEGEQPAVVAPHFGLSANATAALARRARLGLRAAYLQAHLAVNRTSETGCRTVMEKLGGYTAGSVTGAEARRIRAHLLGCASCRSMHAELRDVCSSLRAHAGVLVLLVPASGLALSGAGSSGVGSGLAATLKGLLVGSKMKVGVALASTAAAGAFGMAVGPAMIDPDSAHTIGLPGQGNGVELRIALPQQPPPLPPVTQPVGADHNIIWFPGGQREHGRPNAGPAAVPQAPAAQAPAEPGRAEQLPGTHERSSTPKEPDKPGGTSPRIDTSGPSGGGSTEPEPTPLSSTDPPDSSSSRSDLPSTAPTRTPTTRAGTAGSTNAEKPTKAKVKKTKVTRVKTARYSYTRIEVTECSSTETTTSSG